MIADHLRRHWEHAYADGDATVSWAQTNPEPSLEAIEAVVPTLDAPIVDVGGGSSPLAAALLTAGHRDVSVLELSAAALDLARHRLGVRGEQVHWLVADLLDWKPPRRYAIWHDRAVLHFFTDPQQRQGYADRVREALTPGGHAIIATFAPHGPDTCSGLPVTRTSADEIIDLLGPEFVAEGTAIQHHRTPRGRVQPFTWLIARRRPAESLARHALASSGYDGTRA